ncbi:hypothetical protein EDM00_00870 [Ornithobacterium rhinotracheale]|uniref:hypothetical protein n=1 Tax=Ornithobacterium rhinotracheale TaxID=28251 RepID=UPI00129CE44B|nr:hypothetical protein [Ornithobacterium rhinotracheale]MRI62553.1 hypothetical protein [Ornithobacterium rhinotracheale]
MCLLKIKNSYPKGEDKFERKELYRFDEKGTQKTRILIELELYPSRVCLLSFYAKGVGNEDNKYNKRLNLGAGYVLRVLKACMKAYEELMEDYALIFYASNDEGQVKEINKRFNVYRLFLERYYGDSISEYVIHSSISTNTLLIYHQSFQYKDEANLFFEKYDKKVRGDLYEDEGC